MQRSKWRSLWRAPGSEIADAAKGCRRAILQSRRMARERVFGAMCLKVWALGLKLLERPPHLGDYLPDSLRYRLRCSLGNCLGESLVLSPEGSIGHNRRRNSQSSLNGSSASCVSDSGQRNPPACSMGSSPLSPEVCIRNYRPDCGRGCVPVCVRTCLRVYFPASLPESPQLVVWRWAGTTMLPSTPRPTGRLGGSIYR
jgi:hypothetical protein